jgi:hypothetical protein
MDNPRDIFLQFVRSQPGIQIDTTENVCINIRDHIIHSIFYVIITYIKHERDTHDIGFGPLEQKYFCTRSFINAVDARKWIDENIPRDDTDLIMYVFDNHHRMCRSKYRRALLYLTNMLYFDL